MHKDGDLHFFETARIEFEKFWAECEEHDLSYFQQYGVGGSSWIRGTKWLPGLSDAEIEALEHKLQTTFPESYRLYLKALNAPDRGMKSFGYRGSTLCETGEYESFHRWYSQTT